LASFSINGRTHIVGFSLGAHVAGFAGQQLKNLSRISGEKKYYIIKHTFKMIILTQSGLKLNKLTVVFSVIDYVQFAPKKLVILNR
jgi:hypothetical protein